MIYSKNQEPRTIEAVHTHTHTHTHTDNFKNSKGITLIALVITIIVLLVLAGATLAMISGENGILKKVVQAKESTQKASVEERIGLAIQSAIAVDYNKHGKITRETLISELEKNDLLEENLEEIEDGKWVLSKNGEEYLIYSDGELQIKKGKLPLEYKELEYIESTGTQYIDTNIYPNTSDIYELVFRFNNTTANYGSPIGIVEKIEEIGTYMAISSTWTKNTFWMHPISGGNWTNTNVGFTTDNLFIKYDGQTNIGQLNNITFDLGTHSNSDFSETMKLFAYNNTGNWLQYSSGKLYYCRYQRNNKLIRNFIPCKCTKLVTDADNIQCQAGTIGMYDLVENKFYTNKGEGTFVEGPEVE